MLLASCGDEHPRAHWLERARRGRPWGGLAQAATHI
jgi:hypothetical protein